MQICGFGTYERMQGNNAGMNPKCLDCKDLFGTLETFGRCTICALDAAKHGKIPMTSSVLEIAQRLTASRDRKHASAREKEERQTQLNKWANHRDKAGHASFRMLRQQVTRHSGGFLANFSLMKMLEEPALGSLPRKQWTWLLRWHQLSRRQVFASFSQELWMRGL